MCMRFLHRRQAQPSRDQRIQAEQDMTLGLAVSRHNPDREAESAKRADEEQSNAAKSLRNVLSSSGKVGKSTKTIPETTDKTTSTAPAVTHEVVKPEVHEVLHEQIQRDIHEHHVVQKVQPVIDVEVLPARHYFPGPGGGLVEVAEKDLPGCTGGNQNWHIGEGPSSGNMSCSTAPKNVQSAASSAATEGERKKVVIAQENIPPFPQEGSQPVIRKDIERTEDTVVHTTVAGARRER